MDVKLPNGKVIKGVPEGTPRDQIQQKAIRAGLATEQDFAPQQRQQPERPPLTTADQSEPQSAEEGVGRAVADFFTGEQRTTRDLERTPGLLESGIISDQPASTRAKIAAAAQMTTDPNELAQIIKAQVPGIEIQENVDAQGNVYPLVSTQDGRTAVVDKPGTDLLNISQLAGQIAAFTPAGKASTVPRAIAAEGATQAAIEGGQAALGGDFDSENVALAAGTAGAGKYAQQRLADIAKAGKQRALVTREGDISPDFEKALQREGLTIDQVVDDLDELPQRIDNPRSAARALVKRKLQRGDTDAGLASRRIDDMGGVTRDPAGEEALKQGIKGGDVQAIKSARPGSKPAMREMLKKNQAIFQNTRKAVDTQPTDVIGDSALRRFRHVRQTADKARQELDSIASNQLKGQEIDAGKVEGAFRQQIANLDVGIDDAGKLDFGGSQISKNRSAQRVIKDTMDLLAEDQPVDALRAHKLKRQLDEMIDYKKSGPGMLTPTGERVAKSVRRSLNDSIREVSDDYARVNDTLSQSLDAINDFNDVLGPSINPFAEGAERAVGRDLRGLLSNRKTQTKLANAVSQLDQTAKDLGGEFDDDIGDLVNFNSILQDTFGTTRRESFAGNIQSAVERSGKAAAQGKGGLVDMAIEKGAEGIEKARGINDQAAFKAINRLLRNTNDTN